MAKYYFTYDGGTQSTKVALYRDDMTCVAQHAVPNHIRYPQADWAEIDADDYVEAVRIGIRACLDQSKINPREVRALCGDGIICGVLGIGKDGKAVTPYLPYLDSRAHDIAEELNAHPDPLWVSESGNNRVDPFYPPMIVKWLIENHPGFREEVAKVVPNGSYIAARLAGLSAEEAFIDSATLSAWLVGFDAMNKQWSKAQMDNLGIPLDILPTIVNPWDIVGALCEDEAQSMGLPAGIPIVAGAGDTMQSNLGCGLVDAGMAADVAGTAAMFTVMVDGIHERLSRESNLLFSVGTLPDTYFYWGYIRTGGLSLQWFRDKICDRADDPTFYDDMQERAAAVPPGSRGTLFIPYLTGGTGELANSSAGFVNMTSNSDQAEMWRSILESIAYEYRSLTDSLSECGISIDNVVITEGGSKSPLWNQIKADVLEVPTYTLQKSEGALLASAVMAAYAIGDVADFKGAIARYVERKDEFAPNSTACTRYRTVFGVQQQLVKETMKPSFDLIKGLQAYE